MKPTIALLLLLFAPASPEPRYFRHQRSVQLKAQSASQACFAVGPSIFASAAPQLADLRLYRDNIETPYVIRSETPPASPAQNIPPLTSLLNLGLRGNQTVFDANMPQGNYSDIELAIHAQNFIATVNVTGSRNHGENRARETKLGAYTIFDLTRQRLGRSTILHLKESNFSTLHFRIEGPIRPEDVTGISVEAPSAVPTKYLAVSASSHVTQKGHASIVEFTLPAQTPVDRIAFLPGAQPANFNRDLNISITPVPLRPPDSEAEAPQTQTRSGNLLRVHRELNGRRIDEERLAIDISAPSVETASKWTIAIDNGDDPPLALDSISLQMQERDLCFEAASQSAYTLFYGDPALASPHYDYAALFASQANPIIATLGPEQANPAFQPRPDDRPFTERHPALLWAALLLVVALLGAVALRSAKRPPTANP